MSSHGSAAQREYFEDPIEPSGLVEIAASTSSPGDQQKHVRTPVYREGWLEVDGEAVDCTIVDISPGGAKIRVSRPLPRNQAVTLRIGQAFSGEADSVWQSGEYVGLAFVEAPEVVEGKIQSIVRKANARVCRSKARISVLWDAEIIASGGATPCEILNISQGGARLKAHQPIPVGSTVQLLCSRFGVLEGRVTWSNQGELGVQFVEPAENLFASVSLEPVPGDGLAS